MKCALALHFLFTLSGKIIPEANSKSLASGFNDADPEAIIAWNQRMSELVIMERIASMIRDHVPVSKIAPLSTLTPVQSDWMDRKLRGANISDRLRLKYYIDKALGAELGLNQAFEELSISILGASCEVVERREDCRIQHEKVDIALPLRVNFGGGWSDTPPYCNENGGTVLNAAVTLNGTRPVHAFLQRIPDQKIILRSSDLGVEQEFTNHLALFPSGNPYDPFILHRAALMACGIISVEESIIGKHKFCTGAITPAMENKGFRASIIGAKSNSSEPLGVKGDYLH